jgi:hypothetical protein
MIKPFAGGAKKEYPMPINWPPLDEFTPTEFSIASLNILIDFLIYSQK